MGILIELQSLSHYMPFYLFILLSNVILVDTRSNVVVCKLELRIWFDVQGYKLVTFTDVYDHIDTANGHVNVEFLSE